MSRTIDLQQLVIDRRAGEPEILPAPRRILSRYVLPFVILGGFCGMLGWASSAQWRPRRAVTVVPAVLTRAEAHQAGTDIFQAPGWIEPRPAPFLVTAIAEGVVSEILVVEGQAVKAGEPVARLVDADAKLAVQRAQAEVERREAQAAAATAELVFAKGRLKSPVHLDAVLADSESLLAEIETRRGQLPSQIKAATAKLKFAELDLKGKQGASSVLPIREVQRVESNRDAALSDLEELRRQEVLIERQIQALHRKSDALTTQRRLLLEETRKLADAEAQLRLAYADVRQARIDLMAAELRLKRMTICASTDGRVLHVTARPGTRLMGLAMSSMQDSSTVVSLYKPDMLQVRVDIRLEDVPQVIMGQPVRIETPASPGPLEGEVLFLTSIANIQKNTLEAKIAIKNPPALIRPEMLATVTFLAPERPNEQPRTSDPLDRVLVPRQLVEGQGAETTLWVVDARQRARKRTVRLGRAGTGELVEAQSGIAPTDRLISSGREQLVEGEAVRIVGEDAALGLQAPSR